MYCAYGFHVGCGVTAVLREKGFDARVIEGGFSAWKAIDGARGGAGGVGRRRVIRRSCRCVQESMGEDGTKERIGPLGPLIFAVRGHQVMLDADLARLHGVSTGRINEAFKRNRRRFPDDFAFQITRDELENLRSQIAISRWKADDLQRKTQNWPQFASSSYGGRRYLPKAFTEHGALMAANILRSDYAVQMSVYVIRAFVRQRLELAADAAILKRLAEIDRTLLQHDAALRDIYRKLLPLLQPPPDQPKRRIGFHTGDE